MSVLLQEFNNSLPLALFFCANVEDLTLRETEQDPAESKDGKVGAQHEEKHSSLTVNRGKQCNSHSLGGRTSSGMKLGKPETHHQPLSRTRDGRKNSIGRTKSLDQMISRAKEWHHTLCRTGSVDHVMSEREEEVTCPAAARRGSVCSGGGSGRGTSETLAGQTFGRTPSIASEMEMRSLEDVLNGRRTTLDQRTARALRRKHYIDVCKEALNKGVL